MSWIPEPLEPQFQAPGSASSCVLWRTAPPSSQGTKKRYCEPTSPPYHGNSTTYLVINEVKSMHNGWRTIFGEARAWSGSLPCWKAAADLNYKASDSISTSATTLASHPLISSSPANFCVIDRRNSGQVYLRKYLYSSSVSSAVYRPNLKPLPLSRGFIITPARSAAMSSKLIPSNPADVMVIRHVTPNIVTFSVPFARFGTAKIGGRGTLVKLSSGNLAVFSPVALTEAAKAKVAELGGNLAYIIALDYEHHIFISEWATQYPGVKIIGPEGAP
ncbi:unnamed protein product [Clonostachys rosea f. rosea IK726]|uniref:Uncharacterized protein n=1 Tax=Clonostachys rosea f. rosea IK726 TaxID=1349383 RepID=A0ACA9U500_BIOOC|nr:unnamed protein product [Clonostachys rosea f. rosea IK726]